MTAGPGKPGLFRWKELPATKQLKQLATSPGKTHPLQRQSLTQHQPPIRETEHAEAVLPLLHYPARRDLHFGHAVGPEHRSPRPARPWIDDRAPAGRGLRDKISHGGLRDLQRQRDLSLTQVF